MTVGGEGRAKPSNQAHAFSNCLLDLGSTFLRVLFRGPQSVPERNVNKSLEP
jgi:hypothetical protein